MWICGAFPKLGISGTCRVPSGCVTVHCTLPSARSSYSPTWILAWIGVAILMHPRRPGKYRSWLLKLCTAGFICLWRASCRHTVSMLMWKFNIRFDPSVIGHKKGCWKQPGSYEEHLVWIFPCFAVNESFLSLPFHCSHYSSSDCWEKSSLGDGAESVFMYLIWLARDRGKMDCVPFINWLASCPVQV